MKAYCIGGPMDIQVIAVRDEPRVISFATTPLMYPEATIEVTKVHYRLVCRSHDGKLAVYIAEEAL